MDRGSVENLSSTNSRQINLSRICRRQKYLDGSNSYQEDRNFLDGSRIYREAIETNSRKFQWIEDVIRSVEKTQSMGLNR